MGQHDPMHRRRLPLLAPALALVASCATPPASPSPQQRADATVAVSGSVLDEDAIPVSGATVTVVALGLAPAVTGPDGRFVIAATKLPSASTMTYALSAIKEGFVPRRLTVAPADTNDLGIELQRDSVLSFGSAAVSRLGGRAPDYAVTTLHYAFRCLGCRVFRLNYRSDLPSLGRVRLRVQATRPTTGLFSVWMSGRDDMYEDTLVVSRRATQTAAGPVEVETTVRNIDFYGAYVYVGYAPGDGPGPDVPFEVSLTPID